MLKLIFSGEILDGHDRDQVIANLARLLKQPPDAIDRNLFSGKPVVVKRAESEAIAQKWLKAFADAGALLQSVPEPGPAATDSASAQPGPQERGAVLPQESPMAASTSADTYSGSDSSIPDSTSMEKNPRESTTSEKKLSENAVAEESLARLASDQQPLARRRHNAFVVLGAITLLVLVVLVFLLWTTRPLWQNAKLDQHQQAIANALASEHIYMLGHINVEHLQSLDVLAQDETDLAAVPGIEQGFWESLTQAGIAVHEQVTHIWFAGYFAEGKSASMPSLQKGELLLVLTGDFNPAQVGQWLKQRYVVEAETPEGYLISWLDERTCEKQPAKQVVVTERKILVGSPTQIAQFQERLQVGAEAAPDLTSWQEISSARLASLALFVPENAAAAIGGLPGHMLKEAAATAAPASGIYLGLDPVSLPPGVELSVTVTSDDAVFLREAHENVNARLQDIKTNAAKNWPETIPLYERLLISHSDNRLRATLRFDEDFQRQVGSLISGFFTAGFSPEDANADVEEQLDDHPPQFSSVSSTSFPSFNEVQHLDSQFVPVSVAGPFGVELQHLEVGEEGAGIALNFRAFDLPNINSSGAGLTMRITDLLDAAGNSLAPAPACGSDKMREPVEIGSTWSTNAYIDGKEIPYTAITGSTTVRLPDSVAFADVKKITGVFDYQLPLTVETVELKAPLAGQVIEKYGLRLRFFDSAEGSLRYQYSGNTDALLHVAGLNTDGKPLARNSSMRSSVIFGSGQSVSTDYKGKVSGVRIILASELKNLSYPFEVTSLQPSAGDSSWPLKPQSAGLDDQQWRELQADVPPQVIKFWREPQHKLDVGPILLAIQDLSFSEHFGLQMEVEAYLNNQHPLVGIVGAVEIAVTEIDLGNGEVEAMDLRAQFPLDHDGGYWMNGIFMPNEGSPWLTGKAQLREREIKFADAKALRGTLTVNRALATESVDLPVTLGARWANENFTLQLVRWEKGRLIFSITGNISQLISIQAVNAEGVIVNQPAELNWMFGKPQIVLDIQATPVRLSLVLAETSDHAAYPFEIILSQ